MENKKISKLAVTSCGLVILYFIGFVSTGVVYKSPLDFIIAVVVDVVIIVIAFFIMKMVEREKMRGLLLSQIGFYGFAGLITIWFIGSIILMNKLSEVKDFATSITPVAFDVNLENLPKYSTEDLAKIIAYNDEFSGYKEKMKAVGTFKECAFSEDDLAQIGWGPYLSYGSVKVGFVGGYSIRCYGENKVLLIGTTLKKVDEEWKIADFAFNSDITKNADVEKTELEDKIKDVSKQAK